MSLRRSNACVALCVRGLAAMKMKRYTQKRTAGHQRRCGRERRRKSRPSLKVQQLCCEKKNIRFCAAGPSDAHAHALRFAQQQRAWHTTNRVLAEFDFKVDLMKLLMHQDADVRKNALFSLQKIMANKM